MAAVTTDRLLPSVDGGPVRELPSGEDDNRRILAVLAYLRPQVAAGR